MGNESLGAFIIVAGGITGLAIIIGPWRVIWLALMLLAVFAVVAGFVWLGMHIGILEVPK